MFVGVKQSGKGKFSVEWMEIVFQRQMQSVG